MVTAIQSAKTTLPYLARDPRFDIEKPYGTDFDISSFPDAKATNHVFEFHDVSLQNVKEVETPFELNKHGFTFISEETSLDDQKADDAAFVNEVYIEELRDILARHFPEYYRLEPVDYSVRKRSASFPDNAGLAVEYSQPAALPHADFSTRGAFLRMEQAFPGQKEHYEGCDFDLLNVWRVLKGPNNDWPLAVCDYQSVDLTKDTIPNDVVHKDHVGENWLLQHNLKHAWYYMKDQTVEDLLVFRNANSRGTTARAFHAAFDTGAQQDFLRSSIEVRFVGFRE